jgi:hypothetical protein
LEVSEVCSGLNRQRGPPESGSSLRV